MSVHVLKTYIYETIGLFDIAENIFSYFWLLFTYIYLGLNTSWHISTLSLSFLKSKIVFFCYTDPAWLSLTNERKFVD